MHCDTLELHCLQKLSTLTFHHFVGCEFVSDPVLLEGIQHGLGGRGGNERLLAGDMEAAAPKRGENRLQFSPDMALFPQEQCQGGPEKLFDIRV